MIGILSQKHGFGKKKSLVVWLALGLLCLNMAGLTFYIFESYKLFFNSDAAVANILAKEIVLSKNLFPPQWWYANDDLWVFYKHLLLIPWDLAGKNSFFAHSVSVSIIILVMLALVWAFLQKLGLSLANTIMGCVAITTAYSQMFLQEVYGEVAYTWYFILMLAFLLLIHKIFFEKNSFKALWIVLFFVLIYLFVIANPLRLLVYYVAPFACALFFVIYIPWSEKKSLDVSHYGAYIPATLVYGALFLIAFFGGIIHRNEIFDMVHHVSGAKDTLDYVTRFAVSYRILDFRIFLFYWCGVGRQCQVEVIHRNR